MNSSWLSWSLVLPASQVFALLLAIFALLGWPIVARGVRAIVASERERFRRYQATYDVPDET